MVNKKSSLKLASFAIMMRRAKLAAKPKLVHNVAVFYTTDSLLQLIPGRGANSLSLTESFLH